MDVVSAHSANSPAWVWFPHHPNVFSPLLCIELKKVTDDDTSLHFLVKWKKIIPATPSMDGYRLNNKNLKRNNLFGFNFFLSHPEQLRHAGRDQLFVDVFDVVQSAGGQTCDDADQWRHDEADDGVDVVGQAVDVAELAALRMGPVRSRVNDRVVEAVAVQGRAVRRGGKF